LITIDHRPELRIFFDAIFLSFIHRVNPFAVFGYKNVPC